MRKRIKKLASLALALVMLLALAPGWTVQPAAAAGAESEPNNTIAAATAIQVNTQISGSLASSTDDDWYSFTLPQDGFVSLTFGHATQIVGSSSYWRTAFYTSDNKILGGWTNWQGNTTADETTCRVGLAAGTYYLYVDAVSHNADTYHFTVNYTASTAWEKERNDSIAAATAIPVNKKINGSLMTSTDDDWYSFTMPKDGFVSVTFGHSTQILTSNSYWRTAFYTSDNKILGGWTNWQGNTTADETTCKVGLPAGTYYLYVDALSFDADAYHFTVNYTASAVWEKERNDTITTAVQIPVNTQISGALMTSSDDDWYSFTLPKAGVVSVSFGHSTQILTSNTYWRTAFYTSDNKILGGWTNWQGNTTADETTCKVGLPAGTYYLYVDALSFDADTYHFTVNYTASAAWETERNDSITAADPISLNAKVNGALMTSSDDDWYSFTLPKADTVTIVFGHDFINSDSSYWRTAIYTPDNKILGSWINWKGSATTDETSAGISLAAGTYYLFVDTSLYSDLSYHFTIRASKPDAPAVTASYASGKVTVNWNAVDGAKKYALYRRAYNGSWSSWETLSTSLTGTSRVDESITPGTEYQYRMKACNGLWSDYSASVSVKTASKPAAPTVTASYGSGKVTVKWNAVSGAKKYALYRREYSGSWSSWTAVSTTLTGTSYADPNVTVGKEYQYRMKAYNGLWSDYSAAADVKVISKPAAPQPEIDYADGRMYVTWRAVSGAKKYALYRSCYQNGAWTGWTAVNTKITGTEYADDGVEEGYRYQYRMKAYNGLWSDYSAIVNVYSVSEPTAAPRISASVNNGRIVVTWGTVQGAVKYAIYRCAWENGAWGKWTALSTTIKAANTSYEDKTAQAGVKYQYRMKAFNGLWSAYSSSATVTLQVK